MDSRLLLTPIEAATLLRQARENRQTISRLTLLEPLLDEDFGYEVQAEDRRYRLFRGERSVGMKLGLTSPAKQKTMKIDRPVFGFLTDAMVKNNRVDARDFVQPRIEPELVFQTSKVIDKAASRDEVLDYVDAVGVGAEIIDSRFTNFDFILPDVVADNTSAAGFVLGDWQAIDEEQLLLSHGEISCDGQLLESALLTQILGDPLLTIVKLSEHLESRGESLPKGSIILAGAMTNAFGMSSGSRYTIHIDGFPILEIESL